MEIKADIIDYMGLFSEGVLVLLSVMYDNEHTEGTLYYTSDELILTVDRRVEEKIGCAIEEWTGYRILLESIFHRLVPFDELKQQLEIVRFEEYLEIDGDIYLADEVDGVKTMSATYSNLA